MNRVLWYLLIIAVTDTLEERLMRLRTRLASLYSDICRIFQRLLLPAAGGREA